MAEKPDEQYDMKNRAPDPQDNDYDDMGYKETSFGGTEDTATGGQPTTTSVDADFEFDTEPPCEVGAGEVINESRGPEELRQIFNEIFGSPIRVNDNRELFENCVIRTERSEGNRVHTRLFYKGDAVYYKRGVKGKWRLYSDFKINNPLYPEFEKAKESYNKSATKQVDDNAGVYIPEDVAQEVINEVIDELSVSTQTDFEKLDAETQVGPELFDIGTQVESDITDTETQTDPGPTRTNVGSQVGPDTSQTSTQTEAPELSSPQAQVDISELQAKLTTLESVNRTLEKNLRKKDYELNKLRVENANEDVINTKQQEINDLQAKLRSTELERTQLLLDVEVTDEQLSEASNRVRELTEKNRDITERFNQFKEAANKERQAERQEIINRYYEQVKFDKEQARQEYTESMARSKAEYIEKIRIAEADKTRAINELTKAKEKNKLLEEAEIKQHSKQPTEGGQDGVESLSRGVQQTINKIFSAIDGTNENFNQIEDEADRELYIDGDMEHLRTQAKDFEQRAKRSTGLLRKLYEKAQKHIERKIDEINLRLDREVEYPETKLRLKRATDNNPKVKFERLKKWLKDNGLEATTLVISIGSLITVLATALRKTIQTIAKGAFSFGKAVVKVLSKLGPLFSALGSILMTALGLVSKGLMWLGNNLWLLLVLFVMFLWKFAGRMYNRYKSK